MVIDFFTETQGPLVVNVTNKVTFQAWATKDRADVYDFMNASLIGLDANLKRTILINGTIMTEHRGKGQFTFVNSYLY